jgi:hypothetical protein
MKTTSQSTLQKMKALQAKTIAHADLIKGGTMENCHPIFNWRWLEALSSRSMISLASHQP